MSKKKTRERNRLEIALDDAAVGISFCKRHQTYLEGHEIYDKRCHIGKNGRGYCQYYERR